MADIGDILDALAQLATSTLYPAGTPNPGDPSPVAGCQCRIYPGWPAGTKLDADINSGTSSDPTTQIVNVSIFPLSQAGENVTRYQETWQVTRQPVKTLTAVVSGSGLAVTIGGTVSVPQNVGLRVDGKLYIHGVVGGDTLASIATALAALVSVDQPAHAVGPVVTIPGAHAVLARIGGVGTAAIEYARVRERFMTTIWAPTPALRHAVSSPLKLAITKKRFLVTPDTFACRLIYAGSNFTDTLEKPLIYRRDLLCSVEYPTTEAEDVAEIIGPKVELTQGDYTREFTY